MDNMDRDFPDSVESHRSPGVEPSSGKVKRVETWRWKVRLTYNDNATEPGVPGDLAVETFHNNDETMKIELDAALKRADVDIEIIRGGVW